MYIDSDLIFAVLKPSDRHAFFAKSIFSSKEQVYTSVVTLLELEIVVKRGLSDYLSQHILDLIYEKIPSLKILPLSKADFSKSLGLRIKFSLGVFDSIHAAVALSKDKKIASTDHIFDKVSGLKRIKPAEQ